MTHKEVFEERILDSGVYSIGSISIIEDDEEIIKIILISNYLDNYVLTNFLIIQILVVSLNILSVLSFYELFSMK